MIITLAEAKTFLQIPDTDEMFDTQLETEIIPGILAKFPNSLDAKDYTEYHDGDCSSSFYTDIPNVNSLAFLGIVDEDLETVREYENSEFVYHSDGEVMLRIGMFPGGLKNIKVTYNAGFDEENALPTNLKLALLKDIANTFHDSGYQKRSEDDVHRKPYYWKEISKIYFKYKRLGI